MRSLGKLFYVAEIQDVFSLFCLKYGRSWTPRNTDTCLSDSPSVSLHSLGRVVLEPLFKGMSLHVTLLAQFLLELWVSFYVSWADNWVIVWRSGALWLVLFILYCYGQRNLIASTYSMSFRSLLLLVFTFESRCSNHCYQYHGKICQSTASNINNSKYCFLHSPVFS
jgi:hypothetical protein